MSGMRASTLPLRYFFVGFQAQASKFFIFFIVLSIFQAGPQGLATCCTMHVDHHAHLNFPLIIIHFPTLLSPSVHRREPARQAGLLCSILITRSLITHARGYTLPAVSRTLIPLSSPSPPSSPDPASISSSPSSSSFSSSSLRAWACSAPSSQSRSPTPSSCSPSCFWCCSPSGV